MRIAHVSPHLGGGVGAVLEAIFLARFQQVRPNDEHFFFCLDAVNGIPPFIPPNKVRDAIARDNFDLAAALVSFDVVLFHYWNHPLLASYLGQGFFSSFRIIFWCHNSGIEEPHIIPDYILDSGASVVFTTPASTDSLNIKHRLNSHQTSFDIIPSTRNLEQHLEIGRKRVLQRFVCNLLFVGTLSHTKLHPQSALIFSKLSSRGFSVDVVGDDAESKLSEEVESLNGRVTLHGWVDNPRNFYQRSDVFIYPLRSGHYGTGEQVILEAMAAGLPVVVFDNPAERAIVSHGETGFIAKTPEEFIEYVIKIALDKELYARMSKQGIQRVKENFDSVAMARKLLHKVDAQLSRPKVNVHSQGPSRCVDVGLHLFRIHSIFASSLESELSLHSEDCAKNLFRRIVRDLDLPEKKGAWTSQTKGSPFHYLKFFPESEGLSELCGLIRDHLNSHEGEVIKP